MTVLIRVLDDCGREVRRCDARCHRADPLKPSRCVCGGMLKGCELGGRKAIEVNAGFLNLVCESIKLNPGEHVQMRLTA